MSRFYGSTAGTAKTPATRTGTKTSGLCTHTRGWNSGVKTYAYDNHDKDQFYIAITGGSNNPYNHVPLATIEYSPTTRETYLYLSRNITEKLAATLHLSADQTNDLLSRPIKPM